MAPKNSKKQESSSSTIAEEKQQQLKSRFFSEIEIINSNKNNNKHDSNAKTAIHWKLVPIPENIYIAPILNRVRLLANSKSNLDGNEDTENQPEENQPNLLQMTILESQKIETVRKQSFFSEELTEEERDIVAQRVALQQRQFMEYERREKIRKSKRIRVMFEHVNDEEIQAMLLDCDGDEDEVIYRLTKPGYLLEIRKHIASKYVHTETDNKTADQKAAYNQLLKKRSETLKKTTNDNAKKQYRMGGRLGLDEALQQAQKHQEENPEKAFEGWSQARIRAYQMIDQNPNSYYYRFNAPGEIQRKGQWTEEEQKVFYDRLREVGANGQWGIFSMKVPGRVGYQCSNFYRLLVETQKIKDPNYVLDDRGKAHYLFDKKNAHGQVEKTFRTHSKHSPGNLLPPIPSSFSAGENSSSANTNNTKGKNNDCSQPLPPTSASASSSSSSQQQPQQKSTSPTCSPASPSATNRTTTTRSTRARSKKKEKKKQEETKPKTTLGQRRRRRRDRHWSGSGASEDGESSDDFIGYDNDRSGSYTMRVHNNDDSSQDYSDDTRRRSKRQRRPTAIAMEAGLASKKKPTISWNAINNMGRKKDKHEPSPESPSTSSSPRNNNNKQPSDDNNNNITSATTPIDQTTNNIDEKGEVEVINQHDYVKATNPLPGFIDPITLEEVLKPAISKYGHVMGYDSWVRCLTSWEGKRNICPLTKKPLTKRDLVVLDFDNIEEYRSRIVNL
ncbi:hypothetical protein BDC45DRAFT_520284 [Circinella umbellata]|nr:hypothetical protein BDC45DRAFT_520284 [Circinella umbellata]